MIRFLVRKPNMLKLIIVEGLYLFLTSNWISHLFRYGSDKVGIGKIA